MSARVEEMKKILRDLDYLGDGVYVGHDGYQIVVFLTEGGGSYGPDAIALESGVLEELGRYRERVNL